jgi:hypothetical protein
LLPNDGIDVQQHTVNAQHDIMLITLELMLYGLHAVPATHQQPNSSHLQLLIYALLLLLLFAVPVWTCYAGQKLSCSLCMARVSSCFAQQQSCMIRASLGLWRS